MALEYVEVSEQTPHKKGDKFRVSVKIPAPYTRPMRELIETTIRAYALTNRKLKILSFTNEPPEFSATAGQNPPWVLTTYYECLEDF